MSDDTTPHGVGLPPSSYYILLLLTWTGNICQSLSLVFLPSIFPTMIVLRSGLGKSVSGNCLLELEEME